MDEDIYIAFPFRTVVIRKRGPSPEERKKRQIRICEQYPDRNLRQQWVQHEVDEICYLYALGVTVSTLCKRFDKSRETIYRRLKEGGTALRERAA